MLVFILTQPIVSYQCVHLQGFFALKSSQLNQLTFQITDSRSVKSFFPQSARISISKSYRYETVNVTRLTREATGRQWKRDYYFMKLLRRGLIS
jgi:hypothetical protein